jgi:16S rRNA (guanine966-N2)-methyltransferase
VREAIFNSLRSMDRIGGALVVDLFAGSGALGIEALSRGAAHCTFVEKHRGAAAVIEANLATTKLADRAEVRVADVLAYVARAGSADLVLADPPYVFDGWADLLGALHAPFVVIESDRAIEPPAPWLVVRCQRYGTTVVTFASRETDIEPTDLEPTNLEPADIEPADIEQGSIQPGSVEPGIGALGRADDTEPVREGRNSS